MGNGVLSGDRSSMFPATQGTQDAAGAAKSWVKRAELLG